MRFPSSPSRSGGAKSWRELKNEGRDHFNNERYEEALSCYRTALASNNCPQYDRQILLSNIVACRLHIGGTAQAEAALEDAHLCLAENPNWAKGHVRLASVYSALGRSNDACNALQRALQLDPSNQTARSMLTKELRRGTPSTTNSNNTSGGNATNTTQQQSTQQQPSAPPLPNEDPQHDSRTTTHRPDDVVPPPSSLDIDDTSLTEMIKYQLSKLVHWYQCLNEDVKSLVTLFVALVALYVAFGGRFGLASSSSSSRRAKVGTTGSDAYYSSYGQKSAATAGGSKTEHNDDRNTASSNTARNKGNSYHHDEYTYGSSATSRQGDKDYYGQRHRSNKSRRSWSSSSASLYLPNLLDGSLLSMICLAGILYACQKLGINVSHFHLVLLD